MSRSSIEKGDRIIATSEVSTGFWSTVPKGTKGVVTDVDSPWFSEETYDVAWEDGDKSTRVTGDEIHKI